MNKIKKPFIVCVTGTKGKTTTSRLISNIVKTKYKNVLLTDTHGCYLNLEKVIGNSDSKKIWGIKYPTVCPGRFLYLLKDKKNSIAVLESSIGSAHTKGSGYGLHDVGVLTNSFEDHMGRSFIKTKKDILNSKTLIAFGSNKKGSHIVFNYEGDISTSIVERYRKEKELHVTAVTLKQKNVPKLSKLGYGIIYTNSDGYIYHLSTENTERRIIATKDVPMSFRGTFEPSIYSSMLAIGACIDMPGMSLKNIASGLTSFKDKSVEARMNMYYSKKEGVHVIFDFAHEIRSLTAVANFSNYQKKGKSIGVFALPLDRKDAQIIDYAKKMKNLFDITIIYDISDSKINDHNMAEGRKCGDVSNMIFDILNKKNSNKHKVIKITSEIEAFSKAVELSEKGDIITHFFETPQKVQERLGELLPDIKKVSDFK